MPDSPTASHSGARAFAREPGIHSLTCDYGFQAPRGVYHRAGQRPDALARPRNDVLDCDHIRAHRSQPMERRTILAAIGAMLPAAFAASRASAATPDASKAVYHLADLDKVEFVLGNINNHYKGMA